MRVEEWLPVPGHEGAYDVSNQGRVRSWKRALTSGAGAPRVMRSAPDAHGYPNVRLSQGGITKLHRVHSLVAAAFLGPRPDGLEVCHGDGDPANACAANLRYDTPVANQADKKAHGTDPAGERNSQARLTQAQVDYCRRVHVPRHSEFGATALSRQLGVSQPAISRAVNRKTWKEEVVC